MYESKWFSWAFSPAEVVIYQNISSGDWAGFLKHRSVRRNFSAFQTSFKLGFFVYNRSTLRRLCSDFLFDCFKWNSIFARFTGYNHWNWFVLWWWKQEAKYAHSWLLLTRWRCLFNLATCLADVWKHFKSCMAELN